jgi:hypothetical protein
MPAEGLMVSRRQVYPPKTKFLLTAFIVAVLPAKTTIKRTNQEFKQLKSVGPGFAEESIPFMSRGD